MFSERFRKYAVGGLKIALTLLIVYFVQRQIAARWDDISAYEWHLDWGYFSVSILIGLATFGLLSFLWRAIIASFGHRLTISEAYRIFFLSNLGRYIPGKIWQLFGILYLAGRKGIPADRATASFLAVQMFVIPSSFLVFAGCAIIRPEIITEQITIFGPSDIWLIAAAVVAVSAGVVLWPGVIFRAADWLLAVFKSKKRLGFAMSRPFAAALFLGYVAAWVGYGLAFWFGIRSITDGYAIDAVPAIGAFNGAYQIGYIALFAPGGIGPRELILGFMLAPSLGAIAPAVAVLARVWSIVLEGLAALLALGLGKGTDNSRSPDPH
jgi:hypothetical protein